MSIIQNVIIPENIKSYYIFSKKIVGINIGKSEIHAAISIASGSKRTVINIFEQKLENDNNITHDQKIINALKILKTKLGKYDLLYASFSSSLVIFKELNLPFISQKKSKTVVPFEVEALLPFSLDQAIIDSIIIKENKKTQYTDILVAAVKKDNINQFLNLFTEAKLKVDKITIDIFELFSLYVSVPNYKTENEAVALIEIELNTSKISLIIDNKLKYIRILPKGLYSIAKKISSQFKIDINEVLQYLMSFGIATTDEKYDNSIKELLKELIQEINFTITSYLNKTKIDKPLKQITLVGIISAIPGIKAFTENITNVNTETFQAKKILYSENIQSKISTIPNNFLVSIATSLALDPTQDFNLNKAQEDKKEDKIIFYQLITLAALSFLIVASFSVYSFFRIRNLKHKVNQAETEAIDELEKSFNLKKPKDKELKTLKKANELATRELKNQENIWQQLSLKNRYSFLTYLSELSKCINPKEIQLNLTSINIKSDKVKLYGSVPEYTQLAKLQDQLQCPLFKPIGNLKSFNFKSEPIILTIQKNQEI